ncbi:MAG: hypothetical protein K6B14_08280 [Lachnospiraceae bacterium]|nr:hypothetical protein [Lachnospiraceae bacterium]
MGILWYYLDPSCRGIGAGSQCFYELAEFFHDRFGADKVVMDIPADADESIYKLFDVYDASFSKLPECRFETTLGRLRGSKKLNKPYRHSIALGKLSDRELKSFCNRLVKERLDLVPMPIDPTQYSVKASAVYMEDDKPAGMLLLAHSDQGIEIPYIVSLSTNPLAIMDMMYFALNKVEKAGDNVAVGMSLVENKLELTLRLLLDIKVDDDKEFKHNIRATIPLSFVDEYRRKTAEEIDAWLSARLLT